MCVIYVDMCGMSRCRPTDRYQVCPFEINIILLKRVLLLGLSITRNGLALRGLNIFCMMAYQTIPRNDSIRFVVDYIQRGHYTCNYISVNLCIAGHLDNEIKHLWFGTVHC